MLGDHSLYSGYGKALATTLNPTNESRDRYGRLLAYGWLGGEMLNRRLLANGYSRAAAHRAQWVLRGRFERLAGEAQRLWGGR